MKIINELYLEIWISLTPACDFRHVLLQSEGKAYCMKCVQYTYLLQEGLQNIASSDWDVPWDTDGLLKDNYKTSKVRKRDLSFHAKDGIP